MKHGDFQSSQIRKIAYVPPVAHTHVHGGFLPLSPLAKVATARPARNRTV